MTDCTGDRACKAKQHLLGCFATERDWERIQEATCLPAVRLQQDQQPCPKCGRRHAWCDPSDPCPPCVECGAGDDGCLCAFARGFNNAQEALRVWATVGRTGACIHSKTVDDCAGCQIRVLRAAARELLEILDRHDNAPVSAMNAIGRLRSALHGERRPPTPDPTPAPPVEELDF